MVDFPNSATKRGMSMCVSILLIPIYIYCHLLTSGTLNKYHQDMEFTRPFSNILGHAINIVRRSKVSCIPRFLHIVGNVGCAWWSTLKQKSVWKPCYISAILAPLISCAAATWNTDQAPSDADPKNMGEASLMQCLAP